MSKDGYYGDFGSFTEERRAYKQHMAGQDVEPEVVLCFSCGNMMYQISDEPKENICDSCATEENSSE